MKDTKRHIVEYLVAFNTAELVFLNSLISRSKEKLMNENVDCRVFLDRLSDKIWKAQNRRHAR